jgi:hypothetical protein
MESDNEDEIELLFDADSGSEVNERPQNASMSSLALSRSPSRSSALNTTQPLVRSFISVKSLNLTRPLSHTSTPSLTCLSAITLARRSPSVSP